MGQKIVINKHYGGFGLSDEAMALYRTKAGITKSDFYDCDIARDDPILVEIVETLGDAANDAYSRLGIVEIPDDVRWVIHDYDGLESVHEVHRIWQ